MPIDDENGEIRKGTKQETKCYSWTAVGND